MGKRPYRPDRPHGGDTDRTCWLRLFSTHVQPRAAIANHRTYHHFHGAVRTCHYASFTANAAFLHHMNKAFVTADGAIRANVGARRVFTLATQRCRGNIHAFDDMDTR